MWSRLGRTPHHLAVVRKRLATSLPRHRETGNKYQPLTCRRHPDNATYTRSPIRIGQLFFLYVPPIPIPRPLLARLRRWERNGARFVVEIDGQRVGSIKTAWRTALREADIEHCTPHDLRRTAVTRAMTNGIEKWAACGFFGLTLDVLESVYGQFHPTYLASAVEAMERRR